MNVWIQNPFDNLPVEGYRKQRYWLMAEAFARAGHRVVLWTSDFNHMTKKLRELKSETVVDVPGIELRLLPTRPYRKNVSLERVRSHRAYAKAWELLSKAGPKPDVIIVSLPPLAAGAVAWRLADRFGAKLVVDVQDAWPETFYRLLPPGLGWLGKLVFASAHRAARRAYCSADLVTGVCDRYEALVKGYGAKDYYRAYLGIPEGREVSPTVAAEGRIIRLAYVGNLGRSYDLETVLAGVQSLRRQGVEVTLDIAGTGRTLAAAEGVCFHGMLPFGELQNLLSRCDVGVIPMREDSFVGLPNKLGDYVGAGLRVVSSLTGETAQLLARYDCGRTYVAGDVADFARAVRTAKDLPQAQSLRLAREELSANRIYRDYVRRIESLARKGSAT